jgi:hypothetical protein
MPTIAIVDGILILLYFNDHAPAHFHAKALNFMRKFGSKTARSSRRREESLLAIDANYANGHWPIAMG